MESIVILVIITYLSGKYLHCHLVLIKFPSELRLVYLLMCSGHREEKLEFSNKDITRPVDLFKFFQ